MASHLLLGERLGRSGSLASCSCTGGVLPVVQHVGLISRRPALHLRYKQAQRSKTVTAVAALEEPATQVIESVDDILSDVNNQSADTLYQKFDALLDRTMQDYDVGDRIVGTVASVDKMGAFIDVGSKSPAYLPINEVSNFKVDKVSKVVQPEMEREFEVAYRNHRPRRGQHEIVLTLKTLEQELFWKRISQVKETGVALQAKVFGVNPGGLNVRVDGVMAFVPSSQVPIADKEDGLEALVGKTLTCHILELEEAEHRLVLSARKKFQAGTAGGADYKVGDVVLGTVQSVQVYGAFLDLGGGQSGLLHVSQISHERVTDVSSVLSVGDQIKVMVLTFDTEKGRLSLSTRKLEPTPGDMIRDPALVFSRADEMAAQFRARLAEAEKELGSGNFANPRS